MHHIFLDFIDHLAESLDAVDLCKAMAETTAAMHLPFFAYLSMPQGRRANTRRFGIQYSRTACWMISAENRWRLYETWLIRQGYRLEFGPSQGS